jgi:hypothetical protein
MEYRRFMRITKAVLSKNISCSRTFTGETAEFLRTGAGVIAGYMGNKIG